MALEHLCSHRISPGTPIFLPRGMPRQASDSVIKYKLVRKRSNGKNFWRIDLLYANGSDNNGPVVRGRLNFWVLPKSAMSVDFIEYHYDGAEAIIPVFYDAEGNTLKIGNH